MKLVGVAVVALVAGLAAWFLLRGDSKAPAREPDPAAVTTPGPSTATTPRPGPSLPAGSGAPTGPGPSLPSPDDPTAPVVVDHRQGSGGTTELPPGEAVDPGPQLAPTVTSAFHADVKPLVLPCVAGAAGAGGKPGRIKVTTTSDIKGGTMTVTDAKVTLDGVGADVDPAKVEACVQKALVGRTQSAGATGDVGGYEVRLSYLVR